ncbi:Protein trichome birefringence-like 23 [Linum grandiflorum]
MLVDCWPQNCMMNGRPDSGYMYWRWKPRRCDLPAFDALRFLVLMRDKTWGLIGDSISRNHVESRLCMLSTVIETTSPFRSNNGGSLPRQGIQIQKMALPYLQLHHIKPLVPVPGRGSHLRRLQWSLNIRGPVTAGQTRQELDR